MGRKNSPDNNADWLPSQPDSTNDDQLSDILQAIFSGSSDASGSSDLAAPEFPETPVSSQDFGDSGDFDGLADFALSDVSDPLSAASAHIPTVPEDDFPAEPPETDILPDTYRDNGEYRTYDGSREYRSFDSSLPEASEEEWYHYSDEDMELDAYDDVDCDDGYEEYDESAPRRRGLKIFGNTVLTILTVLSVLYLVAIYSNIPFVSYLRTEYIKTAMNTLSHKWMATAIIPGAIIDDVMIPQYESEDAAIGKVSEWGDIETEALPTLNAATIPEDPEAAAPAGDNTGTENAASAANAEKETFYELFWELDQPSMDGYLVDHPEVLSNGWAGIDINESKLGENGKAAGTSISTIYGDQVLAVNAREGVILIRMDFPTSRGVMAICKDVTRLTLCPAETLGIIGQTAGNICDANNGLLAISGSTFYDPDGSGNGGEISGLAVCSGNTYGVQLGGSYKRLELRSDNKMYVVDSYLDVNPETRDACEFMPAVIIDGEYIPSEWTSPNPRVVLGQTKKLEAIMVVMEGRFFPDCIGCGVNEISEAMLEYGCVQAMNLDGGTSAMMYYEGESIIRCSNENLPDGRTLPTAWVYRRKQ